MLCKFIGKDNSLKLKAGEIYDINLKVKLDGSLCVEINKNKSKDYCYYNSFKDFFKDWSEDIDVKIKNNKINNNKIRNNKLIIDLGNTRGISRNLDKLSRVVIPKEFMKSLNLDAEDNVEIFLLEDGVYIRKKYI
ncbi:MAG: AbrB/MazE/SpoVT family DNA-binding domain-containing protein [Bacilli bacterium]